MEVTMKIVIRPSFGRGPEMVLDVPLAGKVTISDENGDELFTYDFDKARKLELVRMCEEFNKELANRDFQKRIKK